MLIFVLFTVISFILGDNINANLAEYSKDLEFGFHEGGKYEFQIEHGGNCSYLFIIQTKDEIAKYLRNQDLFHPCEINSSFQNFHVIQLKNGEANFSSKINQEGIYNLHIMSCSYYHDGFSYKASFINPDSFISSTEEPCHIPLLIIILLFIYWIFNWFNCFSLKNVYHMLFTFGFPFLTIDKYISYLMFQERYHSDVPSQYLQIHLFFYVLASTLINFSITSLNLDQLFDGNDVICFVYSIFWNIFIAKQFFSNSFNELKIMLYLFFYIFPSLAISTLYIDLLKNFNFLLFSYLLASLGNWIYVSISFFLLVENDFLTFQNHLLFDISLIVILTFLGYPLRMRPDVKRNYHSLFY